MSDEKNNKRTIKSYVTGEIIDLDNHTPREIYLHIDHRMCTPEGEPGPSLSDPPQYKPIKDEVIERLVQKKMIAQSQEEVEAILGQMHDHMWRKYRNADPAYKPATPIRVKKQVTQTSKDLNRRIGAANLPAVEKTQQQNHSLQNLSESDQYFDPIYSNNKGQITSMVADGEDYEVRVDFDEMDQISKPSHALKNPPEPSFSSLLWESFTNALQEAVPNLEEIKELYSFIKDLSLDEALDFAIEVISPMEFIDKLNELIENLDNLSQQEIAEKLGEVFASAVLTLPAAKVAKAGKVAKRAAKLQRAKKAKQANPRKIGKKQQTYKKDPETPWSAKGRLKAQQLPTKGRIRFIPDRKYNPSNTLFQGQSGGLLDKYGNEWVKGPSRTQGHDFEWDVILSPKGQKQLGWINRKLGRPENHHLNVSPEGEITH